jgi:hypothetical protein
MVWQAQLGLHHIQMSRRDPITISDDEDDDANQSFPIGARRPGPSQARGSGREKRPRGLFSWIIIRVLGFLYHNLYLTFW